ncbi:MAG: hypothetical protein J5633_01160 [Oscillospiraceae bacterium]|nr:hypothetical protein [Oscillospiraceae bacterium]
MLEEINRMLSKYKREPGSDEGRTTSAENDEQEPDRDLLQRISEEFAELAKGILYGGPDFEDKNKKLCERPLYAAPEVDADWNAPDRSDEDGRTPGDDDDIINYY